MDNILIIGHGVVGSYINQWFKNACWVDEDGEVIGRERERWNLGFICVPTPQGKNGRCDMSIVKSVVDQWKDRVKYFCCKSTVEIGTCQAYQAENINFCFSPEYIGETVMHPGAGGFVILGGPRWVTKVFAEAWTLVTNSQTKIYQTDGKTAELVKLMENSFIATKVTFVNEFFKLAEAIGVDYNELRELWLADERVSRSHTYCYKDNRGFNGKCLPKDLNNLAWYFKNKEGVCADMIEFLLEYNHKIREDANG